MANNNRLFWHLGISVIRPIWCLLCPHVRTVAFALPVCHALWLREALTGAPPPKCQEKDWHFTEQESMLSRTTLNLADLLQLWLFDLDGPICWLAFRFSQIDAPASICIKLCGRRDGPASICQTDCIMCGWESTTKSHNARPLLNIDQRSLQAIACSCSHMVYGVHARPLTSAFANVRALPDLTLC